MLTAKIDGNDMQVGDEIGIYDGTLCVGAGKLTQILNGSTIYLGIKASKDDPNSQEIDGFTEGHSASFRVWDVSEQTEISSVEITYESGFNNVFSGNGTCWYHINGNSVVEQEIPLLNGWNIFSLYVTPENIDMRAVIQPLIEAGRLVKVQDETGDAIEYNPNTSLWINDIGNWSRTEGYKIRVNAAATLSVSGTPIDGPVTIGLLNGWNIISYPSPGSYNGLTIVNPLITAGHLVKVQDETGDAIEYNPNTSSWLNDIGTFDPDEGYKVRVNANLKLQLLILLLAADLNLQILRPPQHISSRYISETASIT